jgi:hypothetical protein
VSILSLVEKDSPYLPERVSQPIPHGAHWDHAETLPNDLPWHCPPKACSAGVVLCRAGDRCACSARLVLCGSRWQVGGWPKGVDTP